MHMCCTGTDGATNSVQFSADTQDIVNILQAAVCSYA